MGEAVSFRARLRALFDHSDDRVLLRRCGSEHSLTLFELRKKADELNLFLSSIEAKTGRRLVVGVAVESDEHWLIANFGVLLSGNVVLPVPLEFSNTQLYSLLSKADVCLVENIEQAERLALFLSDKPMLLLPEFVWLSPYFCNDNSYQIDDGIVKIIHTSGTTSNPKGVLITDKGLSTITSAINANLYHLGAVRYFSMVPFSLLIEQVLGIYLPLLTGGSLTLKPRDLPDFSVQSGLTGCYLQHVKASKVNCLYLPPKLLEEAEKMLSVDNVSANELFGDDIPHIVTGGAKISPDLLQRLSMLGVTVYEGYGLSENSSVVSMNTPAQHKRGSVGKPLPHVEITFDSGELLIKGPSLCAGYIGVDSSACKINENGFLYTGDMAHVDDEGFLYIDGRKKNIIILSNARNVCPEWVEQTYRQMACFDDIVVFGDGDEFISAAIFSNNETLTRDQVEKDLRSKDKDLPGFSRVSIFEIFIGQQWRNLFFTVTGRPKREAIEKYIKENDVTFS